MRNAVVATRTLRRDAGLTLVELMMVLVLASVVILAATQIHSTISTELDRGTRVSDSQQTMRAAMEVIERHVRLSGRYLGTGVLTVKPASGAEQDFPVVQWTDGGLTKADQISLLIGSDVAAKIDTNQPYQSASTKITGSATQFKNGDLILLDYYDTTVGPPARKLCVKQLTQLPGTSKTIEHGSAQTLNATGTQDLCASKLNNSTLPAYMRLIGRSGVSFRINTTDDPRVPYLEMDPDGPLLGTTNGGLGFQRLAPNVEDLQFAFQLAKTATTELPDLTAANQGWVNSGTLTTDQVKRIRNVRITLVVRVPREEGGMSRAGIGKGERPQVENREASTSGGNPDGYVRKRLESIVQIRNMGMGI